MSPWNGVFAWILYGVALAVLIALAGAIYVVIVE